jgi:DNA-binding response OmpR family regulator
MADAPVDTTLPTSALVVDDEQSVLDVLTVAFKRSGMDVKTALTAEAAMELLQKGPFGALVTDKNLPGKSGLDLIREARLVQPYIAAVMITGYISTDSVLEALRLGANDYIVKPFTDLMLVVQRVKQAIEHQKIVADRAALAAELRKAEKAIRARSDEALQTKTELDLFQTIVELRIEDATKELLGRIAQLEGEVSSSKDRRAGLKRALLELAQTCREQSKKAEASAPNARAALEKAADRLSAEAEILS